MIRSVTKARACYLLGAVVFALVAVAVTRARFDMLNPRFLFDVLLPTLVVSFVACFMLVGVKRVAGVVAWAIAGVLVPIGSVAGYLVPIQLEGPLGFGELAWFELAVASIITVPVGLVGHFVLRWIIRRRFYLAGTEE
jgi:hypothetical protein